MRRVCIRAKSIPNTRAPEALALTRVFLHERLRSNGRLRALARETPSHRAARHRPEAPAHGRSGISLLSRNVLPLAPAVAGGLPRFGQSPIRSLRGRLAHRKLW